MQLKVTKALQWKCIIKAEISTDQCRNLTLQYVWQDIHALKHPFLIQLENQLPPNATFPL